MNRTRIIVVAVTVVALVAIGGVVGWRLLDRPGFTPPQATGEKVDADLASFYDQPLQWRECAGARCTTVRVPIDYADPSAGTTRLAVSVHPAGDSPARGSLFVNPGGPGGSALDFAASMARQFGSSVTDAYDIVGVDPRGVGKSSPLQCLGAKRFDAFTATDPDPDDAAELTALRASITDLGDACEKNSGALAEHVSTEEVARDMDVVRALLGRQKLDWFGASYGTQLGATYANLFPTKVGRMVLDGAVDPDEGPIDSAFGQATGFQRAFDAYAADCIKRKDCPLGGSVAAARTKVAALLTQLESQPMRTSGDRELTEGQAFYGLAVPLYGKENWPVLTLALGQAFGGDGTSMLLLSDAYFMRQSNGTYASNQGQVIYAVDCLDTAEPPTLEQVRDALPRFEKASPVFGKALGWGALSCSDWPAKATSPQQPITAEGAPPIVVVGTTRDPATPYESAVALADELSSGVLLSRDGDGHTAYNSGNECIDDAVDSFFVDGTVPEPDTTC